MARRKNGRKGGSEGEREDLPRTATEAQVWVEEGYIPKWKLGNSMKWKGENI